MKKELIYYLLEDNIRNNNYRVLKAMLYLLVIIIPVTIGLELMGLTVGLNMQGIFAVVLITCTILLFLFKTVKKYGRNDWTKWVVIIGVFFILISFRIVSYGAIEVHTILFLTIILSIFYFDYKIVLFSTAICIIGDYILSLYYPQSIPTDNFMLEQAIRYLNYLWVGIAGAIGTHAMRELLQISTELKYDNDRLHEDIERERNLEKMRKDFIAEVSHELKSPLGLVQGYAEAIRDGVKPNKNEKYINVIIEETESMGKLITDMLDLSQIEKGFVKLNLVKFYIDDLTDELIDHYKSIINEKNLNVAVYKEQERLLVLGDIFKIRICLVNLICNAIQYSPHNGNIYISFNSSIKGSRQVLICKIENEGTNLQEEDLEKIWLPFHRTKTAQIQKPSGTGLGLTITKNILLLHDSKHGVENTVHGVTFNFSLPFIGEKETI